MAEGEVRVVKEMGVSHQDFFRVLPRVMGGVAYAVEGRTVRLAGEGRTLEMRLSEEHRRSLGNIVHLPYTMVELVFTGYSAEDRTAFLAEFERQFFRGGG
jgi:hypothetical protein